MCGIIATTDNSENWYPNLIAGIRSLKYRGYDSIGFGILDEKEKFHKSKFLGFPSEFPQYKFPAKLAIGHTRWASNSKPSLKHTHPISYENVHVVHNGIVENYKEIYPEAELDTEAIPYLIYNFIWDVKNTGDLSILTEYLAEKIKGDYAICAVIGQIIYCTSRNMPLLIAKFYAVSDEAAFPHEIKKFYRLKNGEYAVLNNYRTYINNEILDMRKCDSRLDSKTVKVPVDAPLFVDDSPQFPTIPQNSPQKSPIQIFCPTDYMMVEIEEQIDIFSNPQPKIKVNRDNLLAFGCGSSYNACLLGRKFSLAKYFGSTGSNMEVEYSSELLHRNLSSYNNKDILAVSQSGESKDVLSVVNKLFQERFSVFGLLNNENSTLAKYIDDFDDLGVGPEKSVAATKTFLAQCLYFFKMFECEEKMLSERRYNVGIKQVLDNRNEIKDLAEEVSTYKHFLFLGSNLMYPIALEGALKFKELTYSHCESTTPEETKHGILSVVDGQSLAVFLLPNQDEKIINNINQIRARDGKVLVFTSEKVKCPSDYRINVDKAASLYDLEPFLTPIIYTVPLQLLAYYVAKERGLDVDFPRHLSKSVTV